MYFDLYAYCFMANHVHLFIKEQNSGDISKIMTQILSRYATWFNIKYTRSGTLFSNRYKSEPVEDNTYYLGLIRYIHKNPSKAKMVSKISEYPYSSYTEILQDNADITNVDFTLNIINESDRKEAIKQFEEFHELEEPDSFEITDSKKSP